MSELSGPALVAHSASFAAERHKFHKRKSDDSPYINHPLGVADILVQAGINDSITLAAAHLHDTVEDVGVTFEELEREFGPIVTEVVREVTDDKTLKPSERKRNQIVRAAACANFRVAHVKLADKIHNLESFFTVGPPRGWSVRRIQGYFLWCKAVTDHLVGWCSPLTERLATIYCGTLTLDGQDVPVLPPDDGVTLKDYYKMMDE
jgi:guanosine-3',5'-bis(diphosphate) 3'-pyrophosphohydrolase